MSDCVNENQCSGIITIGSDQYNFVHKIVIFSLLLSACVMGAQKNSLIVTVLLSTHNTCFGLEIRKVTLISQRHE